MARSMINLFWINPISALGLRGEQVAMSATDTFWVSQALSAVGQAVSKEGKAKKGIESCLYWG